ncbi:MAG: hypothetical protein ACXVZU_03585 [Methanobacteriaceae archaeon]
MTKKPFISRISNILRIKESSTYIKDWHHLFFFCCLTLIVCSTFFIGAVPTRIFGHDIFFLLDNGWRIINGQSTHVDFTSAWGPVTFLVVGLGMLLSGGTADGVGYGSAVYGLIIGIWSYYLCRNRMVPVLRVLLCLYLVSLVVAPFPLGIDYKMSSHAMVYNRYGYALLALIMIDIFSFKISYQDNATMLRIGTSSGLVIAITFFLKASYFGGAIILTCLSIYSKRFSQPYSLGLTLGFIIGMIALLSFIQFDFLALVNDLKMAAESRANSISYNIVLAKFTYNFFIIIFIILLISLMWIQVNNSSYISEWSNYGILFFGLVVLFTDMAMLISNQQFTTLPLSAVFSLLIVNKTILSHQYRNNSKKTNFIDHSYLRLVIPGSMYFLVFFGLNIAGLGYGVLQKYQVSSSYSVEKFIGTNLAPLVLFDNDSEPRSNGHLYTEYINDGLNLIQNNSKSHETILTMDMFNPFSYSLGRRPAKGGIAAAAYNYTISDQSHPSADIFLGSADIVMVPKQPASPSIFYDGFYNIYESSIKKQFELIAESDFWYLYHRK